MGDDIVDNLDSTDPERALSARQGNVLYNMITNVGNRITGSLDEDGNIVITFGNGIFWNSSF